jgi:hypothetical protein
MEPDGKVSFQTFKLQRSALTTVCSHSAKDMAAERDKRVRTPLLYQLSKGDQSNEVLATVDEVAAERSLCA